MAVPKRKMSRANTRSRKAKWLGKAKATNPHLVPIKVNGERKLVPRRLVKYYRTLEN